MTPNRVRRSGLRLDTDARLASVTGRVDTLLISAGLTYVEALRSDELLAGVRRIAGRARRVGSTCVGAFVLAAAGLLDGRRAIRSPKRSASAPTTGATVMNVASELLTEGPVGGGLDGDPRGA